MSGRKRKQEGDSNIPQFKEEWEAQYVFTLGKGGKPSCLICGETVSQCKKYNLERHHKTNHSEFSSKYPPYSQLRKDFIAKKKLALEGQQSIFKKKSDEVKSAVLASFEISYLRARKKKPATGGEEVIKPCLEIVAKLLPNNKEFQHFVANLSLSSRTCTRRLKSFL